MEEILIEIWLKIRRESVVVEVGEIGESVVIFCYAIGVGVGDGDEVWIPEKLTLEECLKRDRRMITKSYRKIDIMYLH